jgi:hypothetical protein
MTTTVIRQKLYDYIRVAEDKKLKAIYTMLEGEIEEAQDFWKDKDFITELEKRSANLKEGKIKGFIWDEVKSKITSSSK